MARRQAVLAYAAHLGWAEPRRVAAGAVPEVAVDGPRGRAGLKHLIDQLSAVR